MPSDAGNRGDAAPVDIGSRLELFVDRHLVAEMRRTAFRMHAPQPLPLAENPLRGAYLSVLKDGDLYRAYYREYDPSYSGKRSDGNEGETTRYAESADGNEWTFPDLGLCAVDGSRDNKPSSPTSATTWASSAGGCSAELLRP